MQISQINQLNNTTSKNITNNTFGGRRLPECVRRANMSILVSQDVWAPRLSVKLPESNIEKGMLLRMLTYRKELDKFVELTNKRFILDKEALKLQNFIIKNPNNSNIDSLKRNKEKYREILTNIDKDIAIELEQHRSAYEYFQKLSDLEARYIRKSNIKWAQIEEFWNKITQNNINKDGKYTTDELIKLISDYQVPAKKAIK